MLIFQLLLMQAGIRKQNREWLLSYLSPAPSPLQEHGGCAKLCSNLGWLLRAPCAQTPLPLQYWVSHAEKALQQPSPEMLVLMLCREDVPLSHDLAALLLKAIDCFSGGNAEMPDMEQGHSGCVSAYLSGSTWLQCTALNMCDCLGLREGLRFAGALATKFQHSCELFP